MQLTRREFMAVSTAAILGVGVDTVLHDSRDLAVEHVQVPLAHLPPAFDGVTIAQLSDFHYDRFNKHLVEKSVTITNNLKPDLIALTGDFVTARLGHKIPDRFIAVRDGQSCSQVLAKLRAPLGVFAVLGNHDHFTDPDMITEALQATGIQVLRNRSLPLEKEHNRLWVAGVGDVLGGDANIFQALKGIPTDETTVLLAHEPDYADSVLNAKQRVDLQLSGHSHGGQIRLPFIGPPYLPRLARKYVTGLRRLGPLTLYTNRGVGTIRVPVRLNCPPEITLFTLKSDA